GKGADLVPVVPAGPVALRGRRRGPGRLRRRRTRAAPPRRGLAAGLRAPRQRRRHRARARLTARPPKMDDGPNPDRGCALCAADGGALVVRAPAWRVVLAGDPDYPAFTRVIWNAHVAEMSDLGRADCDELMRVVLAVEEVQRA